MQLTPLKNRRYDAALLFLLYPLDVVDAGLRDLLLYDCARFLKGERGFRRYLGDSYFAPDYEDRVAEGERTRDYSEDMAGRDELLDRIGDEAQWCLFDPILSAYYGRRYLATANESGLPTRQAYHFLRTLSQITPRGNVQSFTIGGAASSCPTRMRRSSGLRPTWWSPWRPCAPPRRGENMNTIGTPT